MTVQSRPPIPESPETPALRFFKRGQQLQRLQQHVTENMVAEIERDRAAFEALTVTDSASAMKVAAMAMTGVASGTERVSDVQLMLQLFFCRHVDNFQIFLEETLRAIYHTQRGLLKRADQITVAQVLTHATMDEFVDELIESRIHKLAYKSIRELASIVKEELKFDLFSDRKTSDTVELAFDVRNLVTHNYGVVNKIFRAKHPDAGLPLGEPYPVLLERIAEELNLLIVVTGDIEKRAKQKFKLYASGA